MDATDELHALLRDGMGREYRIVRLGQAIVVGHQRDGIAVVVATVDRNVADDAARDLDDAAAKLGCVVDFVGVAVARNVAPSRGVIPFGRTTCRELGSLMARTATGRPRYSARDVERVLALAKAGPTPIDDRSFRVLVALAERAARGRPYVFSVSGVEKEVSPQDVMSPKGFLPAILISAADAWAIPVAASGSRGGFHVRLLQRTDGSALLDYEVIGIDAASPFLVFLAVSDALRRMDTGQVMEMTGLFVRFRAWLETWGHDVGELFEEDLDVRIQLAE